MSSGTLPGQARKFTVLNGAGVSVVKQAGKLGALAEADVLAAEAGTVLAPLAALTGVTTLCALAVTSATYRKRARWVDVARVVEQAFPELDHRLLAAELRQRLDLVKQGGGKKYRQRHEEQGKLFVRERIDGAPDITVLHRRRLPPRIGLSTPK